MVITWARGPGLRGGEPPGLPGLKECGRGDDEVVIEVGLIEPVMMRLLAWGAPERGGQRAWCAECRQRHDVVLARFGVESLPKGLVQRHGCG